MITTVTLNAAIDKLYIIDSLEPYQVMRVKTVNNTAGGKGINVAKVAALAGEPVTAMGLVGGQNGRLFTSLLANTAIRAAFTEVSGETRCCVNVRDTATNHSTEFLEPGCPVEAADLERFLADYREAVKQPGVVTISGSMPKGAPTGFYKDLVKIAVEAGRKVILDTSGPALGAALEAKPTMIKPNTDEIRQLLEVDITSKEELIQAAQKLHQSGIEIVTVSLGKDGALTVCGDGAYQGMTPNVPVVNTVGCGDSMVAGFAIGLSRGYPIEETIRLALAISTANALTLDTGSFRQEDLERLLGQVEVQKLR